MQRSEAEKTDLIPIIFKGVVALLATMYFFSVAMSETGVYMLSSVDLVFHEAGHTITFFLPDIVSVMAGSLLQVIIPLGLFVYFFIKDIRFGAALMLFWFGQSVVGVSIYVRDAIAMQLPLLGGEAVIHDWNYLLTAFGVLEHTKTIADMVYGFGLVGLTAGSILSLFYSFPQKRKDLLIAYGVVVLYKHNVLLVQQASGKWAIPFGLREDREDDATAAKRVALQQTGFSVGLSGVPTIVETTGKELQLPDVYALCPVRLYVFRGTVLGETMKDVAVRDGAALVPVATLDGSAFIAPWVLPLITLEANGPTVVFTDVARHIETKKEKTIPTRRRSVLHNPEALL